MLAEIEKKIELKNSSILHKLSMNNHEALRLIAKTFTVRLGARGDTVTIKGEKNLVKQSVKLLNHLALLMEDGRDVSLEDIRDAAFFQVAHDNGPGHKTAEDLAVDDQGNRYFYKSRLT